MNSRMNSRMNEAINQSSRTAETPQLTAVPRSAAGGREQTGAWRTPGYTVIETALEVTAYSLNAR